MKKSYIWALGLTVLLTLWVISGQFYNDDTGVDLTTSSNTNAAENFTVRVKNLVAQPYVRQITISGYTEALKLVQIKSEIEGSVIRTPIERGVRVVKGTVLCEMASYDRVAILAQARALSAQRKLEFEASTELGKKGNRSKTQIAASKALYDAAKAQVKRAEVQLDLTKIKAPFDGLVEERQAEVGSYLKKGEACATLMFEDPFLAVGEVSDKDVRFITKGIEATVKFDNDALLKGKVRFVASSARSATRTFRIEVELDNSNRTLKDGLSTDILIPVLSDSAQLLPPSTLVLSDEGLVGVRGVEEAHVVFYEIKLIDDVADGIWVTGLPETFTLITVGQEFVKNGQKVGVSYENAPNGDTLAPSSPASKE
jgi:multidrug efflux system membrane fusion protein